MHKRDVAEFLARMEEHLFRIHGAILSGTYRHDRYERFYVDDPKRRHISKASVRDRVVHQAVVNAVGPLIEPSFVFDSYAARVGKGTHAAVDRLDLFLRQASSNGSRRVFALKCDVRKYFDSIRHDLLIDMVRRHARDEQLLWLTEHVVRSHASDAEATRDLPLGNVTSQLFANLHLNGFDHWMKERVRMRWYVRFCDDFVVVHPDRSILESAVGSIGDYLADALDLRLHPNKISIRTYAQGVDFVGWVLRPFTRTIRVKTHRRFSGRVRNNFDEYRRDGFVDDSFGQSLQSCLGLLAHGNHQRAARQLREEAWRITRVRTTAPSS